MMSSMNPAEGERSWTSTALTSVAALGSWPLIVCSPWIGIQTTLSAGVLEGAMTPATR
jgi:hypothetical protein